MRRAFLVFLLLCAVDASARRLPETIIKVGVVTGARSFNLSCETSYDIYEMDSGARRSVKPLNDHLVRPGSGGIMIDGRPSGRSVRLVSSGQKSFIRINGRRYRDNIIIYLRDNRLTVINELGLEDYIYGILPKEVNPEWPEEALKAQAVISRTYVLRNLGKHNKDGFDVCTETHCQVYGGVESEKERTSAAVEATRAEVLIYDGELAQSLFHASCGGHTENPNCVWTWDSDAPPYLRGIRDRYCANSPHQHWKSRIKTETVRQKLARAGYNVGEISAITMSGRDASGRPDRLKVKSSEGLLSITPAKFRMAIDPWLIKSALITDIDLSGGDIIFEGRGWGHAVGMCQWGAKEMGARGYNYRQILRHYYPGTKTEKWEE